MSTTPVLFCSRSDDISIGSMSLVTLLVLSISRTRVEGENVSDHKEQQVLLQGCKQAASQQEYTAVLVERLVNYEQCIAF
jgi:hypothetical protein